MKKIQDFEILGKLGQGSYGVVWKALEKSTNNICVLKTVQTDGMSAEER